MSTRDIYPLQIKWIRPSKDHLSKIKLSLSIKCQNSNHCQDCSIGPWAKPAAQIFDNWVVFLNFAVFLSRNILLEETWRCLFTRPPHKSQKWVSCITQIFSVQCLVHIIWSFLLNFSGHVVSTPSLIPRMTLIFCDLSCGFRQLLLFVGIQTFTFDSTELFISPFAG